MDNKSHLRECAVFNTFLYRGLILCRHVLSLRSRAVWMLLKPIAEFALKLLPILRILGIQQPRGVNLSPVNLSRTEVGFRPIAMRWAVAQRGAAHPCRQNTHPHSYVTQSKRAQRIQTRLSRW